MKIIVTSLVIKVLENFELRNVIKVMDISVYFNFIDRQISQQTVRKIFIALLLLTKNSHTKYSEYVYAQLCEWFSIHSIQHVANNCLYLSRNSTISPCYNALFIRILTHSHCHLINAINILSKKVNNMEVFLVIKCTK